LQEIAKRIVSTSKFAPRGTRGCGSPFTHQIFGVAEGKYEVTCDDNLLVIVQIESQAGVDNVEDIAGTEGVDVVFVGEQPRISEVRLGLILRAFRSREVDERRVWGRGASSRDRKSVESDP
jgi:2-keto-3-deoxy-L-rhamnonate aldolase RhmA